MNRLKFNFMSILIIFGMLSVVIPVRRVHAAASTLDAWTNISSSNPGTNSGTVNAGNLIVSAGTDRLFVVAACYQLTGGNTMTSISASLGGTTLTQIGSTGATNMSEHCYMGYLLDAQIPAGSNALTITYDVNGTVSSVIGMHIYWASFADVDQGVPISDSNVNTNGAANVTFGAQIDYLQDGITFYVAGNIGTPATMTAPAGFSQTTGTTTNNHSSFVGLITSPPHVSNGFYAATTSVTFGGTTGARSSIVVVSLTPAVTVQVGDGTSPADQYVNANETNNGVSVFTLYTNWGAATVTQVVVTGINTNNIASGGVKLWLDNGTTPNEWDPSDTQIGSGVSFTGFDATFTGLNLLTATTPTQYLVTYDISVSPNDGDTLTGYISGANATHSVVLNDDPDATLTIDTADPDTFIVSNPADPDNNTNPVFTFNGNDGSGSGISSFECQVDGGGISVCTSGSNFGPLSDGSHTFEVRTIDNAGNVDSTPAIYTWKVDTGYPTVLFNSDTTPSNGSKMAVGPTQITVAFSEDIKNDGSTGAANTIANYLLVEDGANNTFDTVSCLGGLVADDAQITINNASYTNNGGSGPFVATLNINGGSPLSVGDYRLFICGTTSIEDLSGNELNNGVSDATLDFSVVPVVNRLPATGFPQGYETVLPSQPSELAYASFSDLWLEIPKLDVKMSIVGVPQTDGGWDVTWLNKNVGWLNGSAFPTWTGNSVITGHVWDALNRPGPFALLRTLRYGDVVKVHAFGQIYFYEVRESRTVLPTSLATVFKHEERSWVTLITCEDYKERIETYSSRRMVRAVLIDIQAE